MARVEAVEERLKDRRAAFKLFCANVKRTARAGEFLGRMRLRPLFRTFAKCVTARHLGQLGSGGSAVCVGAGVGPR